MTVFLPWEHLFGRFALALAFFSSQSPQGHDPRRIVTLSRGFVFEESLVFKQCHASTLTRAGDGTFLVAWFGGTHEKHDDVGVWLSKGRPGAWSPPAQVAKLMNEPHWNPVLFGAPDGTIILYFKTGKTIDNWKTWKMISRDHGISWTPATELVPGNLGGRGPVRNKPIILSNGMWLAGASKETKRVWEAFVDRSEDGGTTWTATPFLPIDRAAISGEGIIQPTLWESSPGHVHMLLRSSSGRICRSDSEDHGLTWCPVYKTSMPNPNSGIDLTRLRNGALVLAYNNDDKNWGARRPLSMAVSTDNGKAWQSRIDLETGVDGEEFSYPAMISFGDTVAVTYTWKRQRIAFWAGRVE